MVASNLEVRFRFRSQCRGAICSKDQGTGGLWQGPQIRPGPLTVCQLPVGSLMLHSCWLLPTPPGSGLCVGLQPGSS